VHASNPNPQKGKMKFKSIREYGYATPTHGAGNATSRAGLTLIHSPYVEGKFGKRVYLGNYNMSDKDVYDLHMQQIRMKGDVHTFDRAIKIKEEQEFSKFVHEQLKKDHAKQEQIHRLMKADFVEENLIKRLNNMDRRKQEEAAKKDERYDHFPFRGSDTIEKFREDLRHMQRQQFLQYINSDEYKKAMQTSTTFNATRSTVSPLTDQLSATMTARNPGLLDDINVPSGDVTGRGIKMINFQKDSSPHAAAAGGGTQKKTTVKTLFDHGFDVRNKLVIYDDDPRIEAVMAQALDRHQKQVLDEAEFLKEANSHVMNAKTDLERASELKKKQKEKQQSEMRKILDQQLDHRNRVKLEDQDQRRENYATHFGPEPEDEEIKRNREK
jgi:hypothetical protein